MYIQDNLVEAAGLMVDISDCAEIIKKAVWSEQGISILRRWLMKSIIMWVAAFISVVSIMACGSSGGGGDPVSTNPSMTLVDLQNGSYDEAYGMAVQPDGKIIIVGSSESNFGMARYNQNGIIDSGFGNSGRVVTDIDIEGVTGDWKSAVSAAVQADGKIVVVGEIEKNEPGTAMAVVRYNTDGSIDTEFGTKGVVITAFPDKYYTTPSAVTIQDGKILAVALVGSGDEVDFGLARYNPDGSLDGTFGTSGLVVTDASGINKYDAPYAIAIDSNGKIVVAGFGEYYNSSYSNYYPQVVVARYNDDGTLDTSFDTDGIAAGRYFDGRDDRVYAIAIQPDGKLILAGNTDDYMAVTRMNDDGSIDTEFGTDGVVIVDDYSRSHFLAATLQTDGKIVLAGDAMNSNGEVRPAIVRLMTDGTLDASFDGDGKLLIGLRATSCEYSAREVTVQADGRIAIATSDENASGDLDFALIRYLP